MASDKGKRRLDDENNHVREAPSRAKRIRVSQACNECRKKKERCDGVHPRCGRCSNLNRTCRFDAHSRRRGLPVGYVRGIEVLLGIMFHSIDGIEDCATAILRGQKNLPAWHREQPSSSLVNSLAESWRHSGTMKELEHLLAGVEPGDDSELSTREQYEKLQGAFMDRLVVGDNTRLQVSPPIQFLPDPINEQVQPDMASEIPATMTSITHMRPLVPLAQAYSEPMNLPHNWSHLLERYFTDTHSWFPVARKHDVLRQAFCLANSYTQTESQEHLISSGDRAALFATLAYACYRDALSLHDNPEQPEELNNFTREVQHGPTSLDLSRRLQDEATSILNKAQEQADIDLGHIQALLVLTILRIDQGFISLAWITIGQAVYTAAILDILPVSQNRGQIPLDDKQRRLCLGIYILETLLSQTLGRRPHLRRSDLAHIDSLPIDGIEEWEAWRPFGPQSLSTERMTPTPGRSLSIFNTFFRLATLLNDQAHGLSDLEATLGNFQSWKTTLPSSYCNALENLDVDRTDISPQILNLSLASLSIDAMLQIRTASTMDSHSAVTSSSLDSALAYQHLETILKHKNLTKRSRVCPLVSAYISIIKYQVDHQDRAATSDETRQLARLIGQFTGPTNSEKSSDPPQRPTAASSNHLVQPSVASTGEGSIQFATSGIQGFESLENQAPINNFPDGSLFDSLSFLDTADCSHQSEQFLENLGISGELTEFDVDSLFTR